MIVDLNSVQDVPELVCDVCIVGAGAAGLAIATELLPAGKKIVILESGGFEPEPSTQVLYDAEISGLPHAGVTQGRFRIVGGSTTQWGGQALPLMPSDFEKRDWVAHSGWPIQFDDLKTYYERACRFLMVDNKNFDTDLFEYLPAQPSIFDPQKIWYHFSKWSPKPSLRETYLLGLRDSSECTLLLHANVTNIGLEENLGRANAVVVRSLGGRSATVRPRHLVLCVGGIETARLLLVNNSQQKSGLGNQHDLVGRFFQDHPNAQVGWVESKNPARVQKLLNVFHKRGLKYSVRCTATSSWQREHRTLNASMGITFVQQGTPFEDLRDVHAALRSRKISAEVFRKLLRIAAHPGQVTPPIWHYLAKGRSFAPGAGLQVGLTCEQEPDPESRILLSSKLDALGMPLSDVRWKVTDLTLYTLRQFAKLLREQFRAAGLGEIELDAWLRDDLPNNSGYAADWRSHISDQYHHIGTARMNDSPQAGVVDRDCRVHGISNLYIGSSAVFPTSGHSNPTLTILALAMRLADHLKRELA